MKKKLRLGGVVALLLAVASITVASAASSPTSSSAGDDNDVEVIRVTEIIVQEAGIDLGEPGDGLGDQFVFSGDLFRHGEKVGIDGGVCTIVRLEPRVSATSQCVATAELPKGQITVQGLLTFSEETEGEPSRLAITGGTGNYRTAHGELIVTGLSETESRLTFRIIR
jgi:hypothetical protein